MSAGRVITIDGPSGSGKGTIAARVAAELGWDLLDSGALYRLVGLSAAWKGVDFDDHQRLADLARHLETRFTGVKVLLEEKDVTNEIRTEKTGNYASLVGAVPEVREALLARQREFARPPGLVADGRDMGTVVFPHAALKVFLDASPEIRAERRYKQLKEKGLDATFADLVEDIRERDQRDRDRAVAPLRPADDAVLVDSTSLSIDEVLDQILGAVRRALPDLVI